MQGNVTGAVFRIRRGDSPACDLIFGKLFNFMLKVIFKNRKKLTLKDLLPSADWQEIIMRKSEKSLKLKGRNSFYKNHLEYNSSKWFLFAIFFNV